MRPPAASAFRLGPLFLFLVSIPSYAAEVRVTLPLEGYYRAGRYMPVRVEVRGAPADAALRLTGEGVLPTEVATVNGRADGVAPVLVLREEVRQLAWSLGEEAGVVETVLRPLGEGERLVGFNSAVESDVARLIFPDESVIAVRIDPADLGARHETVWEPLDALVVDDGASAPVPSLASAGVVVAQPAKNGAAPPGWERVGNHDVTRPELLGPQRGGVVPSAFAPVQGWRAESPAAFRTWVLLVGVVVAIAILGSALVPGRRRVVAIVLMAVVATWWLNRWWRKTTAVMTRAGDVLVVNDANRTWQRDTWRYRTSLHVVEMEEHMPWNTLPVLERDEDAVAMGLQLWCDQDGRPRTFRYRLLPGRTIGWFRRDVHLAAPDESVAPVAGRSPMDRLAERMYLRPGYVRAGIVAEESSRSMLTEVYPTTVIRREPPAATGEAEPRIGR